MGSRPIWVTLLVAVCATALGAREKPETRETIARRAGAVKGGFPTPSSWSKALPAGEFLLNVSGRRPAVKTTLWTLYDDKTIYVKARCQDRNAAKLLVTKRSERDVWRNDCVEFFLGAPDDQDREVQLIVDAAGQRQTLAGDRTLGQPWRSRVVRAPTGYTVWIAVPYAALDWPAPRPGDCWRIKMARTSQTGGGGSMWPSNPDAANRSPRGYGVVYFGHDDLLPNGDFETLDRGSKTRPKGWGFTSGNSTYGTLGKMDLVRNPLRGGGRAVRLRKTVKRKWYPYLRSPRFKVTPGRTYELSAWVRSDTEWRLSHTFYRGNRHTKTEASPLPPSKRMMRFAKVFNTGRNEREATVGVRLIETTGTTIVDNMRLRLVPRALARPGGMRTRPNPIRFTG